MESSNWDMQLPQDKLRAMATRLRERRAPAIRPQDRTTGRFPLSFAQERLWFLDRLEPNTAFYNIPGGARILGELDLGLLDASLAEVVRRHGSLRTTFGDEGGRPYQMVVPHLDIPMPLVDLAALPEARREAELERLSVAEVRRPFDLARGPLLRVVLFRLAARDQAVVYTIHHIVSDGWSSIIFLREVAALYDGLYRRSPSLLPPLPIQYTDFSVWQREHLQGEVLEGHLAYWRERLAGSRGLELPTDRPRPAVETFRGRTHNGWLPEATTAGLYELARVEGASLFMVLLAGFGTLLARATGQTDVPVGSPIANRNRREVEGVIGFFANTLVLRADLSGAPSFRELVGRLKEVTLGAYAHEDLPFERVVEALQPERDMSRNPLFQVMCVLQNQPRGDMPAGELAITPAQLDLGSAKFDFTIFWSEEGPRLWALVEHNSDLFDEATARRLFRHYVALLGAAAADPDARIGALPLLEDPERHQLLWEWNDTALPMPSISAGLPVQRWFEQQARATPAETALVFGGRRWSFQEVEDRANRLARGLARRGVGPERLVGVCLERSDAMVVGALATLKAGGALVALDPAYPRERLARIVEDADLAVLLTDRSLLGQFPGCEPIALLLEPGEEPFPEESAAPLSVEVSLDHPMYVIYTSGSTGQPKGIVVPHRAFANLLAWQLESSPLAGRTRTVQFATFGFCVSFQEIFSALCSGGTLVVADEITRRDVEELESLLTAEGIERLHLPYAALKHLADSAASAPAGSGSSGGSRLPSSLREVITAGEQLRVTPSVAALFARLPGCSLHNQYGASETHVVSALTLTGSPGEWPSLPSVGRPVANVRIHLLDERLEPVLVGVRGELYAGGACLARGYLNDPVLTAQKMVPDSFAGSEARNGSGGAPGARLYRTGDLARHLANGEIEYLGRIDGQVKIRGFRVELGEVETALARHPSVRDAAVVALPGPIGPRLAAYVVPEEGRAFAAEELRLHLKERLPDYMVPASWVEMASLPLNANGKLDQAALPPPAPAAMVEESAALYEPPRTPVEELLCGIWSEVLGRPRVGVRDDFFELGGHSLLATQVVSRARAALGVELPLRRLFEAPVLGELARRVEAELARRTSDASEPAAPPLRPLPPEARQGDLPLSFAQERLWFLDRLQPGTATYNMPLAFWLRGRLSRAAFAASLATLAGRHEVLRTTFAEVDGRPVQRIAPPDESFPALPLIDLSGLPEERREPVAHALAAAHASRPFDLARGTLIHVALLRLSEEPATERHAILCTMHHVVSDGWSLGVLVRELGELYAAALAGRAPALPPLPVQYADFAVWQRAWLTGAALESQLAFWRERLAGAPPAIELPFDRPRPAMQSFRGGRQPVALPVDLGRRLAELGRGRGATPFMTLLAGFAVLLARLAGQRDVVVGTPVANRTRREIEDLIGFFVNTLALRVKVPGGSSFADLIEGVREATLAAYAHQDLPFERLVEELQPERSLAHSPLLQVMFALQNAPLGRLDLPALELELFGDEAGGAAKFDLTLSLTETPWGIAGIWDYNADLFDPATVARMSVQLGHLLAAAAGEPRRDVLELSLLSGSERQQLREWNATPGPSSPDLAGLAQRRFERQAARTPEAVAIVCGEERLSYGEQERRANRLAHHLRALGVGPERRVGLCLRRSPELVVAMLAVLEAGGAYVPLDPSHPPERLLLMLEDAGAELVLMGPGVPELPIGGVIGDLGGPRILHLESERGAIARRPSEPPPCTALPGNLAYVLFTSGSTGRPKGVAIEHRSVEALLAWAGERFAEGPLAGSLGGVLAATSISFDLSVFELLAPLSWGGRAILVPDALHLAELAGAAEVTLVNTVPSAMAELLRLGALPRSLRVANLAGEPLPGRLAADLHGLPGIERVFNLYGPSEDTTYSTEAAVPPGEPVPAIGRPLPGTRVHLLDGELRPVIAGAAGELCLAGAGLARGYLGRPDLTAERFVPDPEGGGAPGSRLYRTGDRARYRAHGEIEYLGRIDGQVKIRGFRIELGEVEAALSRHPSVRDVAIAATVAILAVDGSSVAASSAVAAPAPSLRLAAYVVPEEGHGFAAEELRLYLRDRLPEYMVPASWMEMAALPRNTNGKLDRAALPPPPAALSAAPYVAPRSAVEEVVAGIWREVLGVARVGVEDSFFTLGGHSLLATQVISRVSGIFHAQLPLRRLFETPTVAALAAALVAAESSPGRNEKIAALLLHVLERREQRQRAEEAAGAVHA